MDNKIVGIIAVVVIVVCVGFVGYKFIGGGGGGTTKVTEGEYDTEKEYVKCLACNQVYPVSEIDPNIEGMAEEVIREGHGKGLKCVKCGENKAYPGIICIHCKKLFVPDYVVKGKEPPEDVICKNCGKSAWKK